MTTDLGAVRRRLAALDAGPPTPDLRLRAAALSRSDGRFPLLGSGVRADAYPALLWNGVRLHRLGAPAEDGLLLVAEASTPAPDDAPDDVLLALAVDAGLAVSARLPRLEDPSAAAHPGVEVLAAAATAATAAGVPEAERVELLDLAGVLAVVGPPGAAPPEADLRAGHALAAGWLAVRLHAAGLVAAVGAARVTAATVLGDAALAWPEPLEPAT